MIFEKYARDWLERQEFSKNIRKTTRQSVDYICKGIGNKEIQEITDSDVDQIFINEQLFRRHIDFIERTFRVLDKIFTEIREKGITANDPVLHIYDPVVFSHEKIIMDQLDVELTNKSPFVDVSCMWLKSKGYAEVTYNLYYHFLNSFIHPFIGKKSIGLVDQNNIRRIYVYFNTVNTNETWIGQIHLVIRMVFQFAIDKGLISTNPLLNIDDPHLMPILDLSKDKKNAVRLAFNKYGFRRRRLKELSHELYGILNEERDYHNRDGLRKNNITFYEVFLKWHRNMQDGVLAKATADSAFHSMDIYAIPNFGSKPIQEVGLPNLQAALNTYALMGNTSDWYLIARFRSLYDYAIGKGYVSDNLPYRLKSANAPAAVKLVLSDREIRNFFRICDNTYSMYSLMFVVIVCTGIRIREAMAMTYEQIDTELKTVKIQNQLKDGRLIPAVKTRRGRKIRLSETAQANIEAAKELKRGYEQSESYHNALGLIFTNEDGSPLSYTNVNRKLDEIALKMGRPDLTAHTFRHTYMTVSARCGENLDEIQGEVGHGYASDVITEYLHQTDESRHESAIRRQEYLVSIMERYGTTNENNS